jgi:hypothetical protein
MPLCTFYETHRDALSCITLSKKQQRVQKEAFGVYENFSEAKWKLLVPVKFSDRPNGYFWCL